MSFYLRLTKYMTEWVRRYYGITEGCGSLFQRRGRRAIEWRFLTNPVRASPMIHNLWGIQQQRPLLNQINFPINRRFILLISWWTSMLNLLGYHTTRNIYVTLVVRYYTCMIDFSLYCYLSNCHHILLTLLCFNKRHSCRTHGAFVIDAQSISV